MSNKHIIDYKLILNSKWTITVEMYNDFPNFRGQIKLENVKMKLESLK